MERQSLVKIPSILLDSLFLTIFGETIKETEDDKLQRVCPETTDFVDKGYCKSFCMGKGCKYLKRCWDVI